MRKWIGATLFAGRKNGSGGVSKGAFSRQTKYQAFLRDGEACARCGLGLEFERAQFHHRRPRQMGGTSNREIEEVSNCLTLCPGCHAWVESHRELAVLGGFIVSQWRSPSEITVRHALWGAVTLTAAGSVRVAGARVEFEEEEWD